MSSRSCSILGPLALVALVLACASPIRTSHDFDPNVDTSAFETFAWIKDGPFIEPAEGLTQPSHVSPIDDQRIRSAVDQKLTSLGYRKVSRDSADMLVSFAIGTEDKLQVRDYPTGGMYYGGYGYGGWYGGSTVRVDQYTEGTLSIEFWDPRTREAFWVAWGSKRLNRSRDDDPNQINEAVSKILEPFPPRG